MEVRNTSKNTIFIEDIDVHIPYEEGKLLKLSADILKKSRGLRSLILGGTLEIVKYNENEQIEKSIVYTKNNQKPTEEPKKTQKEIFSKTSNNLEVELHGIFYEAGGYGKVNRYLAKNFVAAGAKVKISPKKGQNQLNRDELEDIAKLERTTLAPNHITIDSIIPSFSEISSAKYKILYTTIEAYSVSKQFIECCSQYHEIWVTCLSPDAIIETARGPTTIDKVKVKNEVFCDDGKLHKIIGYKKQRYKGFLCCIKTKNGCEIKATPWHKLYVQKIIPFQKNIKNTSTIWKKRKLSNGKWISEKYMALPPEYIRVDEIGLDDMLLSPKRKERHTCNQINLLDYVPKKWKVDKNGITLSESTFKRKNTAKTWAIKRSTRIKNKLTITKEFAYFLGIYAAEGSCSSDSLSIVMSKCEKTILLQIKLFLKSLGLHSRIRKGTGKSLELRCCSRILCSFLKATLQQGALNKKAPSFIFGCTKDIKMSFLKGLFQGDGWVNKNLNLRVISKQLIYDCASLLMDFNILPSIRCDNKLRNNKKWNIRQKHPTYIIRVGGKQLSKLKELCQYEGNYNRFRSCDNGIWHHIKTINKIDYDGFVYDLTIKDRENFCVQSVLSHNSPHAKEVLEKQLKGRKIFIVPTGVDPDIYNENVEPVVFNPPLKKFIFLSVFGWSYRKGYDLLFKSYFDAFTDEDDVSLLIFSRYMQGTRPGYSKKIEEDIKKITPKKSNLPHYKVVSKIVPESMMPQIYRACDAFVLPSRAEGSCLPPCEASLCGLPVIMTNCSGQRLYLRHDNAYLLEIDKIETLQPGLVHLHFWDEQQFPSLKSKECVNNLAGLMREVYENYDEAKERNKKLQHFLLTELTWKHAADIAIERLIEIDRGLKK